MATKTINDWFSEYGESHRHSTNKLIHWICVPSIFFSIVCLLSLVKIGEQFNLARLVLVFAMIFYVRLSPRLSIGLLLFALLCLYLANTLTYLPIPLWVIAVSIFVLAWIGQFIGHHIEGKKPSFLKDIQFLLIGPAWLMGALYRWLKLPY